MTFNAITVDLQHKLKVGDVVTVEKPGRGWDEEVKTLTAAIINVEPRWGTTPLITLEGHNPNWVGRGSEGPLFEECLEMGTHMVLEVNSIAPYRVTPRPVVNHFKTWTEEHLKRDGFTHPRYGAPKGVLLAKYDEMFYVFIFALSKLNYDLDNRPLCPKKARLCWEAAGKPGLIKPAEARDETNDWLGRHLWLRETVFMSFVQQNWTKLVLTRAEAHYSAIEALNRDCESFNEAMDEFDELLDRKLGYRTNGADERDEYQPEYADSDW